MRRIIYLGGLATGETTLSKHLRSRIETGEILRESGVPVVEFRASVVVGSGSLSFELIRALVDRLPMMICPRWVSTLAQPIGIDDLLAYLVAALDLPDNEGRTFEIGGADQASYGDLMREYATQRGLRRVMISVPLLTPRLSSLWLGLVTPVYARVGRELIGGLKNRSVVADPAALSVFPIRPVGLREAIARAIRYEDRAFAMTRWSDARSSGGQPASLADAQFGSRLVDARRIHVDIDADRAFVPIATIGGERGWYYATWLWRIRGAMDLLAGGVGMRRGRRDPHALAVGETLDFWRVEAVRTGTQIEARGGNESAGPRVARIRSHTGFHRRRHPPDRGVRTCRAVRTPLLVCARARSLPDIRRVVARDRPASLIVTVTGQCKGGTGIGYHPKTLHWAMPSRYHSIHRNDLARAMVVQSEQAFVALAQGNGPPLPTVKILKVQGDEAVLQRRRPLMARPFCRMDIDHLP